MKFLWNLFLASMFIFIYRGNAMSACPEPGCPVVAGTPVAVSCSSEVCNTHVFFTDSEGRLFDLERNLIDHGWPCPGQCPVWDETTMTYVRDYTDLGWRLNQISSDVSCDGLQGTPAYYVDDVSESSQDAYRRVSAISVTGHLMVWSSPADCCLQCATSSESGCTCELSPAEDSCDPPVCECSCPEPEECESWPTEEADLSPDCGCEDADPDSSCCWQTADLTAISGISFKGNLSYCGNNIYARSVHDHLLQFWFAGGSWNWQDLSDSVTGGEVKITDDPACFKDESGVHYVVFRGVDGHLIGFVWNNSWQWVDLTEISDGRTILGKPAIYYNDASQTGHIFARGSDSQLFEWWWSYADGLKFANVSDLCHYSIAGNPSLCSCNGGVAVAFRDTDDQLIRLWKDCQDHSSWRCENLSKLGCGRLIAGDPSCFSSAAGDSVLARTKEGRLLRWFDNGNGWWQTTDMLMDIGCPSDIGMYFSFIQAGSFQMGSDAGEYGRNDDEGPVHMVTLTDPFYLETSEVTQAQWEAVMGYNPSANQGCPACPVENVAWQDVRDFIERMNSRCEGLYTIPTEAEWEYAARSGTNTTWFFGSSLFDLPAFAWYLDNSLETTHPVGTKRPNYWGLYDMYGNVAEWVADAYAAYPAESQVNPLVYDNGWIHIIRGGSWKDPDKLARSASRHYTLTPESTQPYIGIRLKRTSIRD